jgi:hypothetical protein
VQGGRRPQRGGHREFGRHLPEPADLAGAALATVQVALEPVPLGVAVQRVEDVDAAEFVQVATGQLHPLTPRQSRIRINPSRIRVLMVLNAAPSSPATCG